MELIDDLELQIAQLTRRASPPGRRSPDIPLLVSAPGFGWVNACTGNGTSVHIDPHQIVTGDWPGGYCSYDTTGSVWDHFHDLGWW